jgi:hypothetical protein
MSDTKQNNATLTGGRKGVGASNLSDVLLGCVKVVDPVRLALLQPLLQVRLLVHQLTHRLRHTAVGRQVSNQS